MQILARQDMLHDHRPYLVAILYMCLLQYCLANHYNWLQKIARYDCKSKGLRTTSCLNEPMFSLAFYHLAVATRISQRSRNLSSES